MDRVSPSSDLGAFQRWRLIGCGGIVGLLVGAAGAALWFVNRDVQAAATALAEADRLHQAGQPAAAVAKYKEAYWGPGGGRPT